MSLLPLLTKFNEMSMNLNYIRGAGILLTTAILLLTGCTPVLVQPLAAPQFQSGLSITKTPLTKPSTLCEDRFIAHDLDHTTTINDDVVQMFKSNGAGLAINDLDNDGDLDVVLANLDAPNTILWNEGGLTFRKESMAHGRSRAVNIVDFDGDGWQDIVFTRQMSRLTFWRNPGAADTPGFDEIDMPSVWEKAYTMSWADMDIDGDLDLVIASYDTEFNKDDIHGAGGGGVGYYENQDGILASTNLIYTAQALALLLVDVNEDGRLDILVGNDFFLQDHVWLRVDDGWLRADPFLTTAMNTMSYSAGDLNNDGHLALFSGDMKPYATDEETLAAWQPVMEHMAPIVGDAQIIENVLQVRNADGTFNNRGADSGLAATGWSWSAKFGDLDNDGFLDFYVVNGMTAEELFGHLPNNELIEENLVFRNQGAGRFAPMPDWGLNSLSSGRGMSMADMDGDGDLDIVVNNLLAPAQLFENRLCGGDTLAVDLFWPARKNTRAIGARLVLHTSTGNYTREIRAASGYLSGDPARVHFGFPSDSQLEQLEVIWPDGEVSRVDSVMPNYWITITR